LILEQEEALQFSKNSFIGLNLFVLVFNFGEIGVDAKVKVLKEAIFTNLTPAHPKGCRLTFNGKVLKSRHKLKYYKIQDGATIEMDDSANWSDASSSSGSDTD